MNNFRSELKEIGLKIFCFDPNSMFEFYSYFIILLLTRDLPSLKRGVTLQICLRSGKRLK